MLSNLKLAVRTLSKTPLVTAIAILSLALGIGANTAIFSLFDRMLLRPLPVPDPGALVNLSAPGPKPGSNSCNQAGDCQSVFSYPMFRDLERVQTVFTGHRRAQPDGREPGGARPDPRAPTACWCRAATSRCWGCNRRWAGCFTPDDDRTAGAHTRGRPQPRLLVVALRRESVGRGRVAHRQRHRDDRHRRGAARLRGHHARARRPNVFVPISMRETLLPGWKGLDNRRSYWAYLFARLKPGVSIDQARAAMDPPYRAIITDVEVPLQTGLSDQTMQRFRAKPLNVEPGERGQSDVRSEARAPLLLLMGVTGAGARHGLRQHRQPAAGARRQPLASRWRCGCRSAPAAGRCCASCWSSRARWRCWAGVAGLLVSRWTLNGIAALLPPEAVTVIPTGIDGSVLLLRARAVARHRHRLRALSGAAQHPSRPGRRAQGPLRAAVGRAGRVALPHRAGHQPDRAVDGAAGRGRALHQEPLQRQPRRSRAGHRSAGHLLGVAVAERLPRGADARLLRAGRDRAGGAAGCPVGQRLDRLADRRQQLEQQHAGAGLRGRPRHQHHGLVQPGRPGLLPDARHPARSRAGNSPPPTALRAPKVAVVNQAFARKFNLGDHVIGTRVGTGRDSTGLDIEIVGLVQDAKYSEVKEAIPPQIFRPYRQGGTRTSARSTSTCRPTARPRRCSARRRPRCAPSIRTCRSRTPRRWPSRCARTCSSTG